MGLKIDYLDIGAYSLAAHQNSYRLFKGMKLIYELDADRKQEEPLGSPEKFLDVIVRLECDSDVFSTEEWQISALASGQHIMLPERNFQIAHDY